MCFAPSGHLPRSPPRGRAERAKGAWNILDSEVSETPPKETHGPRRCQYCGDSHPGWYSDFMPAPPQTNRPLTRLSASRRPRFSPGGALVCALWTCVMWNCVQPSSAGEPQLWRGVEPSGRRHAVVLACPPGGRPNLESPDTEAPRKLDRYQRLEVPRAARVYPPRQGDRWVHLLTGETCPIAVTRLTPTGLEGIPTGGASVSIPWGALAAVAQPATETELQLFTAEAEELAGPPPLPAQPGAAWSGERSFLVPPDSNLPLLTTVAEIAEGGVSLSWLDVEPDRSLGTSGEWSLELVFAADDSTETLRLQMGGDAAELAVRWEGEGKLDVRDVPHRGGWRHLRVQWNSQGIIALVDNDVLATGAVPQLPWTELRVRRAGAEGERHRPEVRLDDLRLFRSAAPLSLPPRQTERTGLWLGSGDVLYQPDLVERFLNGDPPGGRVPQRDWAFVRGVIPRQTSVAPTPPPLEGWWVRLDWQPRYGERWEAVGSLTGILQEVTATTIVLRHPWLGPLALPVDAIARLTPLGQGRRRELDPSVYHLGNNTRPGWQVPTPEGANRKWTVDLGSEDLRGPNLGLALTVRELEPTGGIWARQGAFHEDLAQGGLLTELWVNDRRVTDLNRWLDRPATADKPARLWIPLEKRMLQLGSNTVELRQQPSVRKPTEFDDLEVWDLAWEQPENPPTGGDNSTRPPAVPR
jgi:hypothetical protein